MAECIIARGGGRQQEQDPIVIPGYATVVATVLDSDGIPVPDIFVSAYDGNQFYRYHTNERGKVMFVTNRSYINIRASNASNINGHKYVYIDQLSTQNTRVSTVIGMANKVNITLGRRTSCTFSAQFNRFNESSSGTSDIFNNAYDWAMPNEPVRFRVTNKIGEVKVGGAGGGGSMGTYSPYISSGGGGGALNIGFNVSVNKNTDYTGYIGHGGNRGNNTSLYGSSGGSSSFLGISANGGGGGTFSSGGLGQRGNGGGGGNGAITSMSGWDVNRIKNEINGLNGYGGGGGAFIGFYSNDMTIGSNSWYIWQGGDPGGGYAAYNARGSRGMWEAQYSGGNGQGGGGGGGHPYGSDEDMTEGGYGGHGMISLVNFL